MGILQLPVQVPAMVGVLPANKFMVSSDNLATITAAGYLNAVDLQSNPIGAADVLQVLYSFNQQTNSGTYGIFTVSISNGSITLVEWSGDSGITLPTVANSIAVFSDTNGHLADNIVANNVVSNASATPGTVRAIKGEMSSSISVMTSGNLVGVRGEVDYVGASGGFLYGVQGKLIPSGTISGSSWNAGVFGQLDISAATINAGQMAPIWGDYGAASHTLTDQTGLYGIAMTNTTAAVLQGQVYLYGGAQNLLLLSTNAGLSGVTYFINSGTGSGSWGNASPPTPSKVLRISVDGTQYYLPLVAQNS